MNEGLLSGRYAKAAYQYALSQKEDGELYRRMGVLADNLRASEKLREALRNPVLARSQKLSLIVAAGGEDPPESYRRFMALLVDHKRENLLLYMALSYNDLYRQANRISVVKLTTSSPVPDFITQRIRMDVERRTHGSTEISSHIDPSIEGGFIFEVDGLRLDASVASQLDKIKREFIRKNRVLI